MRRRTDRYNWAAYYADAYERERKKNNMLAGKIADAQRRQSDLEDNLNRIYANLFWRAAAPLRKLYHIMNGEAQRSRDIGGGYEAEPRFLRYKKELQRQNHSYLEWIRKGNNKCYDSQIIVNGWQTARIPNSDIMLLTYGKGILDKSTLGAIKSCFNQNLSCKIAYADEDFYWEDLYHRMQPWFKPCYSPDTILAFNYWGHLIAAKADLLSEVLSDERILGRNEKSGHAVRFYDLCLCLEEAVIKRCRMDGTSLSDSICHVDRVLYHQAYEPTAEVAARMKDCEDTEEHFEIVEQSLIEELAAGRHLTGAGADCLSVREAALYRRGIKGSFENGQDPDLFHVVYDTSISGSERCVRVQSEDRHIPPHHVVSVVIPSKDHPDVLDRCLASFREKTDYEYYEWIVVDNGSDEQNRSKMEELRQKYGFTYLYEEMPFNFSRMCNMGAVHATGDLLLFMNDDIEIIEHSWLRRMAGQALQPHVGAVGAKLWYAGTQNIQHTGITNMSIGPSHKLITFVDNRDYYYGRNRVTYNMAGVTAACLMVSRDKYAQVGGFDETMAVSYNDVDFCFKLLEAGYYNVQRNDAVLYHYESLSRGLDEEDSGKWERLLAEKESLYEKHPDMRDRDIFYHRALIDNASDYRCNYKFSYEEHLRAMPVKVLEGVLTKKVKKNFLQLTVDRAQIQHKIHAGEPDILLVMGWCYVPGADNALYDKRVLFAQAAGAEGESYAAVPADWHRKDVEAILPGERNIGLSGFVLRILRDDLEPGTYRIGMLCTSEYGDQLLAWSDTTCEI